MSSDPWGTDVPPSWAEFPRHVPEAGRHSRYRLDPDRTPPLGQDYSERLVPGETFDGYVQADGPLDSIVLLLQPGGYERVRVLGSWVEMVAG